MQCIHGIASSFHDTAIFNTGGVVLHCKPALAWDFATGYRYTRATGANGITSSAQYQQVNLSEYYALSKRTGLYALQAFQRTNGNTLGTAGSGHIISATATSATASRAHRRPHAASSRQAWASCTASRRRALV